MQFHHFKEAISNFDGGVRVVDPSNMTATAGIFATYPAGYLSVGEGLADQVCSEHTRTMLSFGQSFCMVITLKKSAPSSSISSLLLKICYLLSAMDFLILDLIKFDLKIF
jgi:hypothetical protein